MLSEPTYETIRKVLLSIHSTIFDIQEQLWYLDSEEPLSPFEEYVVALEDRRFFNHNGVDYRSVFREIRNLFALRRVNGASTIEMQLFRTLSGRYERRLGRKLLEFVAAKAYQRKFSKVQLLRSYLLIAYFGTGLIGSEAASAKVFGKRSNRLRGNDAAQLASMLVYPKPKIINSHWQTKILRRAQYGRLIDWTRPE